MRIEIKWLCDVCKAQQQAMMIFDDKNISTRIEVAPCGNCGNVMTGVQDSAIFVFTMADNQVGPDLMWLADKEKTAVAAMPQIAQPATSIPFESLPTSDVESIPEVDTLEKETKDDG